MFTRNLILCYFCHMSTGESREQLFSLSHLYIYILSWNQAADNRPNNKKNNKESIFFLSLLTFERFIIQSEQAQHLLYYIDKRFFNKTSQNEKKETIILILFQLN